MTREEIENIPKNINTLLGLSVPMSTRQKLDEQLNKVCELAIKVLEQEPTKEEKALLQKWRDNRGISMEEFEAAMNVLQEPQTDGDCISRQAALSDEGLSEFHYYEDYAKMRNYLKSLPPVNPQQKTGYWFEWKPEDDVWRTTCSECGEETRILWYYCPHCGAKMESEGKE